MVNGEDVNVTRVEPKVAINDVNIHDSDILAQVSSPFLDSGTVLETFLTFFLLVSISRMG